MVDYLDDLMVVKMVVMMVEWLVALLVGHLVFLSVSLMAVKQVGLLGAMMAEMRDYYLVALTDV